jgi:hypothetical protein
MLNSWELEKIRDSEQRVNDDSPLAWDDFKELSATGAGRQRINHLLKRLDIPTIPADLRGIMEIRIKRAKGEYV